MSKRHNRDAAPSPEVLQVRVQTAAKQLRHMMPPKTGFVVILAGPSEDGQVVHTAMMTNLQVGTLLYALETQAQALRKRHGLPPYGSDEGVVG